MTDVICLSNDVPSWCLPIVIVETALYAHCTPYSSRPLSHMIDTGLSSSSGHAVGLAGR